MSQRAVFFDRDNTLIVNDGYLGDPSRVELMPGAAETIAALRRLGYAIVTVSNQSGVARGLFTEEDVLAVDARMDAMLLEAHPDAVIDRHEFCPDHPQAVVEAYRSESDRRKPGPGMILDAARELNIDLSRSWVVGDAGRDIEAGKRAGCRTIHFIPENVSASEAASGDVAADHVVQRLDEVVAILRRDELASGAVDPSRDSQSALPSAHADASNTARATASMATAPAASSEVDVSDQADDHDPVAVTVDLEPIVAGMNRLEQRLAQTVEELRRASEPAGEFSVARLLAGVLMGVSLAALFAAMLYRDDGGAFQSILLFAIFVQVTVASLLLMASR